MSRPEKVLAWHFTNGMKLRNGKPLIVGKTYRYRGSNLKICETGYHASERLIDALLYAPGPYLSRVECWGDVDKSSDKLVARNRKVLWTIDISTIADEYALLAAKYALTLLVPPHTTLIEAIEAKEKWLRGEISDSDLDYVNSYIDLPWFSSGPLDWGANLTKIAYAITFRSEYAHFPNVQRVITYLKHMDDLEYPNKILTEMAYKLYAKEAKANALQ